MWLRKRFCTFGSFERSDPPDVFSLAASGQGKLCNWYCNDSPKSLMHCAKAAHCVFHSVNYLQERFSKVITLLSWLNAPRKRLRINQPFLTHTSHLAKPRCKTVKINNRNVPRFSFPLWNLSYVTAPCPELQNGSCSCMLMRIDRRHWAKVPSVHIPCCSLCHFETPAAQKPERKREQKDETYTRLKMTQFGLHLGSNWTNPALDCFYPACFYETLLLIKNQLNWTQNTLKSKITDFVDEQDNPGMHKSIGKSAYEWKSAEKNDNLIIRLIPFNEIAF